MYRYLYIRMDKKLTYNGLHCIDRTWTPNWSPCLFVKANFMTSVSKYPPTFISQISFLNIKWRFSVADILWETLTERSITHFRMIWSDQMVNISNGKIKKIMQEAIMIFWMNHQISFKLSETFIMFCSGIFQYLLKDW